MECPDRLRVSIRYSIQSITKVIPARVAEDTAYRNAQKNSDKQNARIEHDKALVRVMTAVMKDDTELFKQFMDNEGFKRWMKDTVGSRRTRPSRSTISSSATSLVRSATNSTRFSMCA